MGTKNSKINAEYLAETPQKLYDAITVKTECFDDDDFGTNPDPRSPHICRTPLNEYETTNYASSKLDTNDVFGIKDNNPNVLETTPTFKQRIFNKLKCNNVFDPRSPSTFINRTPILLHPNEEEYYELVEVDKSLNLDDTFSNLFISNNSTLNKDEIAKESTRIGELYDCTDSGVGNNCGDDEKDPRSPTVGIDRTPIVFINEDTPPSEEIDIMPVVLDEIQLNINQQKPHNKHLERLKNPQKRKNRKSARIAANKMVYNDKLPVFSTPKKLPKYNNQENGGKCGVGNRRGALNKSSNLTPNKRTPLGCVANKSHLRSKSHELNPNTSKIDDNNMTYFKNTLKGENNLPLNNVLQTRAN